ncbi:MAG: hypothetical protein ACRDMX_06310, partial [Solirubrobacteraceae bacterium]
MTVVRGRPPTRARVLVAAVTSVLFGLAFVSLATGASGSPVVRIAQGLAVFAAGTVLFIAVVVLVLTRVAGWQEPESEAEFEAIVRRAERLAVQDRLRSIPPPGYAD